MLSLEDQRIKKVNSRRHLMFGGLPSFEFYETVWLFSIWNNPLIPDKRYRYNWIAQTGKTKHSEPDSKQEWVQWRRIPSPNNRCHRFPYLTYNRSHSKFGANSVRQKSRNTRFICRSESNEIVIPSFPLIIRRNGAQEKEWVPCTHDPVDKEIYRLIQEWVPCSNQSLSIETAFRKLSVNVSSQDI